MPVKILVCDPIEQDGLAMLKKAGFAVEENPNLTPDQLEKRIAEFDAVIVPQAALRLLVPSLMPASN